MSNSMQPDNVTPSQITPSPTPFSTETQPGGNASTYSSTTQKKHHHESHDASKQSPMDLAAEQAKKAAKKKAKEDAAAGGTLADPGNEEKFLENAAMGIAFQMSQKMAEDEKKREKIQKGQS